MRAAEISSTMAQTLPQGLPALWSVAVQISYACLDWKYELAFY